MVYKKAIYFFVIFAVLAAFSACRSTYYVPDGQYLLNKVELKTDNRQVNKEELLSYIKQKPNRKVLIFVPFHLGVYNVSRSLPQGKITRWTATVIGEEPVIFDPNLNQRSLTQMSLYLRNKGYFESRIHDSVFYFNKKVNLTYKISAGKAFRISRIDYHFNDTFLTPLIYSDSSNRLFKSGDFFDIDKLDQERDRLSRLLKTIGYYYFTKDHVRFEADTFHTTRTVNITVFIDNMIYEGKDGKIIEENHKKYRIREVFFYPDYEPGLGYTRRLNEKYDTLFFKGFYFIYRNKMRFNPNVILMANQLTPDQQYNYLNVEQTYKFLNGLKTFRIINIQFAEPDTTYGENQLDCYIQLTPFTSQGYSVDFEGNNSSGIIGLESNLAYTHRNVFGGAEVFDAKVHLAVQGQPTVSEGDQVKKFRFNTFEYGLETGLNLPQFLLPFRLYSFYKKYNPRTAISVSYNHQQNPDYTRTIANSSFGYYWDANRFSQHQVYPIRLNTVKIFSISPEFYDKIKSTFLINSYKNYFISEMGYSYIFRNQQINKPGNFFYFRINVSTGGNGLWLYNYGLGRTVLDSVNRVGGFDFAQFAISDFDFRFYHIINQRNSFVYRFAMGAGVPYGNSTAMPFIKQFYVGGANSIRGWIVKSIGPGIYTDTTSTFPNQTADFKIELNAEYRFDIFWVMKGAFFIDCGNIWSISAHEKRDGARFYFDRFYKQMALGTGMGLRMDLSYFVIRLDLGLKAFDPSEKYGKQWLLGTTPVTKDLYVLNIGIGYPF